MKQAGGIHWGEGNGVTELLERTCSIHGGSSPARWATSLENSVRPDGAVYQWRKVPSSELSVALVADERFGGATRWAEAS